MRHLRGLVATSNGTWREAEFNGRPHIVVPVVALVEGVLQAMNASTPELVREDEFARAPQGWNGRPVFLGHPLVKGTPVSGNTPKLLEEKSIGTVFNAGLKPKKLVMEAWIDVEKSDAQDPRTLERVKNNEPIEISVGTFVETDDTTGEYEGKPYEGEWHDIVPDHLALLSEDETGACSREMGCGVRAAKGLAAMADKKKKNLFTRVLQAMRVMQPAEEMSNNDLSRELADKLRAVEPGMAYIEAWYPVNDPNRVVYGCYEGGNYCLYERAFSLDANGAATLNGDRIEVEPVMTYEPVVLEASPEALAGKAISKSNADKIQAMHDHSVALGAACSMKAAASCGCKGKAATQENTTMERKERVKALIGSKKTLFTEADSAMLEACSDEAMARFEAAASAEPKTPETPAAAAAQAAAATTPAAPAAAAAPAVEEPKAAKAATMEEVLKTAAPEVRDMFEEGLRVGKARKDATIKTLKDTGRCGYTDEQLNVMSQVQLDQLVALAGVPKAAVDFSGMGTPKSASEAAKEAPAAPDFNAAVKAAREAAKK